MNLNITNFNNINIPNLSNMVSLGVYKIVKDPFLNQWILKYQYDKFKEPKKLYGKLRKYLNYLLKTINLLDDSIGILLIGNKGMGKTQLAQVLSNRLIEKGKPVILVSEITPDESLLELLNNIKNSVIFFDEFGKVFDTKIQDKMLTLLSDVNNNKNIFIFTENSLSNINSFLINRPGRVRYKIEFEKLDKDTVIEYCKDHNVDEKFTKDLLERYYRSRNFNFDSLKVLVEEHKLNPDKDIDELLDILNLAVEKLITVYEILYAKYKNKKYIPINRSYIKEDLLEPWFDTKVTFQREDIYKKELEESSERPIPNMAMAQPFNINQHMPMNQDNLKDKKSKDEYPEIKTLSLSYKFLREENDNDLILEPEKGWKVYLSKKKMDSTDYYLEGVGNVGNYF